MDKTKWIIFGVIVVALFGGLIYFNKQESKAPSTSGDPSKILTEGEIKDHVKGSPDGKVVFIEYGDFQCPGCGGMYPIIKEMAAKYSDKVTFIFRNMPLTALHPNALAAAAAAEAAGLQGKYYEMHDILFEGQSSWTNATAEERGPIFEGYATMLGLDIEKYKQDLGSPAISDKIARDKSTAKGFGVAGTPTFVINGTVYEGKERIKEEVLSKALEDEIKKAYPNQ